MKHPLLLLIAVVAIFALGMHHFFPDALNNREERVNFVQGGIMLVFLLSGLVAGHRRMGGQKLVQSILIWAVLIVGVVLVYSLVPHAGSRLAGAFLPAKPMVKADGTVEIRAASDGQFYVEAQVNGAPVRFLVDTGASDIMLTKSAAERAGIHVETADYTKRYMTANGDSLGAPVELEEVVIGPIRAQHLKASVNGGEMDTSLLGLSFLNQLGGYEVTADTLILKP
jgi:aspartyl protease family protein